MPWITDALSIDTDTLVDFTIRGGKILISKM